MKANTVKTFALLKHIRK